MLLRDLEVPRTPVEVGEHGVPEIGPDQPTRRDEAVEYGQAGSGPRHSATATARFSVCNGDGAIRSSMA